MSKYAIEFDNELFKRSVLYNVKTLYRRTRRRGEKRLESMIANSSSVC